MTSQVISDPPLLDSPYPFSSDPLTRCACKSSLPSPPPRSPAARSWIAGRTIRVRPLPFFGGLHFPLAPSLVAAPIHLVPY